MKNFLSVPILLLFLSIILSNYVYAQDIFYNPYDISTRAYDVIYDKQRKLYTIPADKKRYAVKIVFTKTGKVINFNNKVIQYKNGRFSKIGNDYVSYLNGKLYTIGGKKVENGDYGYVIKIGAMSPHQYFIGNDFTQEDAVKSYGRVAGMTFHILSDGTDFAGSFSDVMIMFDGYEVMDGSNRNKKTETAKSDINNNIKTSGINFYHSSTNRVSKIGDEKVYYWSNGKIQKIGDRSVDYGSDGRISKIGDDRVYYWSNGKIREIGKRSVYYGSDGRINKIGDEWVYYWSNGKIREIGKRSVYY